MVSWPESMIPLRGMIRVEANSLSQNFSKLRHSTKLFYSAVFVSILLLFFIMSGFLVDPDISKAKTISTAFYTNPLYFEQSREKIFSRSWQFIGSSDLLLQNNCYPFVLLENYLDEPLLITRSNENLFHCLSNVCTHRGNLLVYDSCQASHLRCRYHGRLFQLDGPMISMPEFKEVKNFPTTSDDLHQLPLFQWGKWLFTSLQPAIEAESFIKEMMQRIAWMPLDEFVFHPELSKDYYVKAHWALYCENYLEGFHIPFVHSGLNSVIDYGEYTTELFEYSNLQLGIAKQGENCFDLPESSIDYGK